MQPTTPTTMWHQNLHRQQQQNTHIHTHTHSNDEKCANETFFWWALSNVKLHNNRMKKGKKPFFLVLNLGRFDFPFCRFVENDMHKIEFSNARIANQNCRRWVFYVSRGWACNSTNFSVVSGRFFSNDAMSWEKVEAKRWHTEQAGSQMNKQETQKKIRGKRMSERTFFRLRRRVNI